MQNQQPKYSIVIPVYNRPEELDELLESLAKQTYKSFEVIIIEDGSTTKSDWVVKQYQDVLDISYYYQQNGGPGNARNNGMKRAKGQYVVLFDSDCVIPFDYFENVESGLAKNDLDCFGGPDDAHPSFSNTQKAINYAMTSVLTTGGIRGKKKQVTDYQPRSFNMGFKKSVIEKVGGFTTLHPGEDPDLSYRIKKAGYEVGLIEQAKVYHKRRIDFRKFYTQVYKFGVVRVILSKWHKGTFKLPYIFPTLFFIGSIISILLSIFVHPVFIVPLIVFTLIIWLHASITTKSIVIGFLSVLATFIQFFGYGYGFLKSWLLINVLGKDEHKALPKFFFE